MINESIFTDKKSVEFKTDAGSRFHEKFHGVVKPDGSIELVSDGFEDTQEMIESWQPETDIYNIIDRVSSGDITLLTERTGSYMDTVHMPKTYAEMLQLLIDAEADFNMLPADIKMKFDNDLNKFVASFGSEEFYKKLGVIKEQEKQISQDMYESKEGEAK